MKCLHVSNMYPSVSSPSFGTFVYSTDLVLRSVFDVKNVVINKRLSTIRGKFFHYFVFYLTLFFESLFKRWDLIYVHFPSHTFLPVCLSLFYKKTKLVINFHGGDAINQPGRSQLFFRLKSIINRQAAKKADLIVVPSEYFSEVIRLEYDVPEEKIFVNYSGGVDHHTFKPALNRDWGALRNRILFVSRMEPVKDPLFLADFLQLYSYRLSGFFFRFIGSGRLEQDFVSRVSGCVNYEMLDSLSHDELAVQYREHGFIIQTSKSESLGLVALEAMSSGCIPICRKNPSVEAIILPGVDGFLFGDELELLNCLESIASMKQSELEEMANNARKKVLKKYTKEVSCQKMAYELMGMINEK